MELSLIRWNLQSSWSRRELSLGQDSMGLYDAIKNNPLVLVGTSFVAGASMAWGVANAILVAPRNEEIDKLTLTLGEAREEIDELRDREGQLEEQRDDFRLQVASAMAKADSSVLAREYEGIFEILPEEFDLKVLHSQKPVVLLFPESWDAISPRLTHTYLKVYSEYRGRIKFLWCEVGDIPKRAKEYEISAIPTMLMFKNGEIVDRVVGDLGEEELKKFIDKNLRG